MTNGWIFFSPGALLRRDKIVMRRREEIEEKICPQEKKIFAPPGAGCLSLY